jgi:hypothetical protein
MSGFEPPTLDYAHGPGLSYALRRDGDVLRAQVFRDDPARKRGRSRLETIAWFLIGAPIFLGMCAVVVKSIIDGPAVCAIAVPLVIIPVGIIFWMFRAADRRHEAEPVKELVISESGVMAENATWNTSAGPEEFRYGRQLVQAHDQFIPRDAVELVEFVACEDVPGFAGQEGGWLRIQSAIAEASIFLPASRSQGEAAASEVRAALGTEGRM